MNETINGLHKCQPKNTPTEGDVKTFAVIRMPAKNGKKAWIKIKGESAEKGGMPYRILTVTPTGWEPDDYGNLAFNVELEEAIEPATLSGASGASVSHAVTGGDRETGRVSNVGAAKAGSNPTASAQNSDGVQETREHLMQAANLYNLCVQAVDKAVAPNVPPVAQTSEQFQAAVASLFIEASRRITDDGVNWWSYVGKMPVKPLSQTKNSGDERSEDLPTKEYQPEPF